MSRLTHTLLSLAMLLTAGGTLGVACGGPVGGSCQLDPYCSSGGVGAYCRDERDCAYGGAYCCESDHCDGGMCTYRCDDDPECPVGMRCQHGVCFYECFDDRDCAAGQRCKHDAVCEWD